MSRRHGRATIPFGKYRGVRVRLLPDDYLSFLTTLELMKDAKWRWLWDSVMTELRFRGFNTAGAALVDPVAVPAPFSGKRKMKMLETEVSTAEEQGPTLGLFGQP